MTNTPLSSGSNGHEQTLREKLKFIRDSEHPAGPWARNVIQIMDDMKGNPNDPDLLRALGKAVLMFDRVMNQAHLIEAPPEQITPEEIAAIFGLGTHQ